MTELSIGHRYVGKFPDGVSRYVKYKGINRGRFIFEDVVTLNIISIPQDAIDQVSVEAPVHAAPPEVWKCPTLVIDFDDTIATYDEKKYPEMGEPITGMIEMLCKLRSEGWRIIVFTCRHAADILPWLQSHNVPFDGVNVDPENPNVKSGKPYGDVYLDDKGLRFDGDVDAAYKAIVAMIPKEKLLRGAPGVAGPEGVRGVVAVQIATPEMLKAAEGNSPAAK